MKRFFNKILSSVIPVLMFMMLFSSNIYASDIPDNSNTNEFYGNDETDINTSPSYDYVINNYDVNIIVNENNTFDVTETIETTFNVSKHGIFRTIPLKNYVKRLDGSSSKNRTQITNLKVSDTYTISRENSNLKIKIGSADKTVTGNKTYTIKYTYNLGKDPLKNIDEVYYNLIGTEWDTIINKVNFSVTMPKEFDSSKLGFSAGQYGSDNNDIVQYEVNGNVISGFTTEPLNKEEGLTIRLELPEGYFVGAGLEYNIMDYLPFTIPIVLFTIAFLLWLFVGRKNVIVKSIEFYPPEKLNSLDVALIHNSIAQPKDVTSLLIYLASKGYIKIEEESSSNFRIVKMKSYNGYNENEKEFMRGLFRYNNIVRMSDLYNNFYTTSNSILRKENDTRNKKKYFESFALTMKNLLNILCLVSFAVITAMPIYTYGNIMDIPIVVIFSTITFKIISDILLSIIIPDYGDCNRTISKILAQIWIIGFSAFAWIGVVLPALQQDTICIIGYIIGIICIMGTMIFNRYLRCWNNDGIRIEGKIKGFKEFLETAEKSRLESLVEENPTYFYDILPYAYVLNVSDKWIENFELISMAPPEWLRTNNSFNSRTLNRFMNSTMSGFTRNMNGKQSSSSSSSGHSSGGGFSGGGSGGGGGGSW